MQDDKDKIISNLKDKINTLISFFERGKEENIQLFKEKQELIEKISEKDEKIENLEKEIEKLKFASALTGINETGDNEAKHEAKIKINRMVREIDKCISLLNKLN